MGVFVAAGPVNVVQPEKQLFQFMKFPIWNQDASIQNFDPKGGIGM